MGTAPSKTPDIENVKSTGTISNVIVTDIQDKVEVHLAQEAFYVQIGILIILILQLLMAIHAAYRKSLKKKYTNPI